MTVAIAAVLGLLLGSFANVLIARVPVGENWVSESSRCPRCGEAIAWYDNVPVLSWLWLRARCRRCREPIAIRYPVVEVATGAAFVGVYALWGLSLTGAAFAYLAFISIVLVVIDLDVKRLPNVLVLPSYGVGAVLLTAAAMADGDAWAVARAGMGMLAMGGFYGLMWLVYPGGIGFGDVKTAGLLGMYGGFLGWTALGLAWFAGPMLGGVVVAAGLLTRRLTRSSAVPYGPALICGAWVGYVAGDAIFEWYLGLLTG